jgi:hypothetical protein
MTEARAMRITLQGIIVRLERMQREASQEQCQEELGDLIRRANGLIIAWRQRSEPEERTERR